ncbi:unnamed protein product [Discula destructiva]
MSFSPRPERGGSESRHLDLTGDREVVFCHRCSNEWYNDEYGLECPRCNSDICEIITSDNDPRDIQPDFPHDHDYDRNYPDPDEDDIQAAFPPAAFMPRPTMNQGRHNRPVDPNSEHEIFNRFQETLQMLGVFPPPAQAARPNRDLFGGSSPFGPPGGTTRTTTYNTPGGRATFSITTSTIGPRPGVQGGHPLDNADQDHGQNRNFDVIFGNVMGGGHAQPPDVGHPPFENNLQGLLSLLLAPALGGPNAVHGDAVYSQEALDRIVSQLMEAHPQSNAAPPATEDAIGKLEKKKLDREMMGDSGKAECTICIDEMQIGDEVTVLPCKHWFHGGCVVLWLKEHNTCPICRSPIEKSDGNGENGGVSGNLGNLAGASSGNPAGGARFRFFTTGTGGNSSWSPGPESPPAGAPDGPSGSYQNRGGRSPEERQARLNAIRNLAGPSSYGQQAPPESPSLPRYRRDSWSPTSPPPGASSARERSPTRPRPDRTNSSSWSTQRSSRGSSNNNNYNNNNNTGGNSGGSSNPINWLRDRFGGGGGSNDNGSGRRRS